MVDIDTDVGRKEPEWPCSKLKSKLGTGRLHPVFFVTAVDLGSSLQLSRPEPSTPWARHEAFNLQAHLPGYTVLHIVYY